MTFRFLSEKETKSTCIKDSQSENQHLHHPSFPTVYLNRPGLFRRAVTSFIFVLSSEIALDCCWSLVCRLVSPASIAAILDACRWTNVISDCVSTSSARFSNDIAAENEINKAKKTHVLAGVAMMLGKKRTALQEKFV